MPYAPIVLPALYAERKLSMFPACRSSWLIAVWFCRMLPRYSHIRASRQGDGGHLKAANLGRARRTGCLAVIAAVATSVGYVLLAVAVNSDSSIAVTQDDFTLKCPVNTVAEGATLTCTLANNSAEPVYQ